MGSIPKTAVFYSFIFEFDRYAVTGSKDGTIVKWDLMTLKKILTIHSRPKKQKQKHKQKQKQKHNAATSTSATTTTTTFATKTEGKIQHKGQHAGGILSLAVSSSGKYQHQPADPDTSIHLHTRNIHI